MIYKFVKWDVSPLENHKDTTQYKLHERIIAGDEPTRDEKNRNLVFTNSSPVYKLLGYAYDFREFLNEYFVETRYYGIIRVWAWDKTAIRKNETTKCLQIGRIVQVD